MLLIQSDRIHVRVDHPTQGPVEGIWHGGAYVELFHITDIDSPLWVDPLGGDSFGELPVPFDVVNVWDYETGLAQPDLEEHVDRERETYRIRPGAWKPLAERIEAYDA